MLIYLTALLKSKNDKKIYNWSWSKRATYLNHSIQLISRKFADLLAQIEDKSPEWHTSSYVPEGQMQHEGQ